jgi:hypothetical protein
MRCADHNHGLQPWLHSNAAPRLGIVASQNRGDYRLAMILFVLAMGILTAIQFAHVFVIAAVTVVFVAASMGVSRLVFRIVGEPTKS